MSKTLFSKNIQDYKLQLSAVLEDLINSGTMCLWAVHEDRSRFLSAPDCAVAEKLLNWAWGFFRHDRPSLAPVRLLVGCKA